MKRIIAALIVCVFLVTPVFAGGQFRVAGMANTPVEGPPPYSIEQLPAYLATNENTLTGWQWEVIFDRLGLGMHYGIRFYETDDIDPWYLDWKGDFFLSYHLFGGGSLIDPFFEFGWGNAGTTSIRSPEHARYPDWEDEYADGDAVALALYSYAAAGLALDLNGLLLGVRVAYQPDHMVQPIPATDIEMFDISQFEVGLFGGVALGSHNRRHRH